VKKTKKGFTLVELLTTVGIITILIAMLIPALNMVRKIAKEAEQKAQFNTIGMGLEAYKSDFGSYPGSSWQKSLTQNPNYQGGQRLAEALVGMDLFGFHPDSAWMSNGRDTTGQVVYPSFAGVSLTQTQLEDNLKKRRGPYLENPTNRAFRLRDLYPGPSGNGDVQMIAPDTYVVCDVFKAGKVTLQATGQMIKAGTPILYYKADTSKKTMETGAFQERIYNILDNIGILAQGQVAYGERSFANRQGVKYRHILAADQNLFYNDSATSIPYKVIDPKVTTYKWPYRPDSYLLISAGWDGIFGNEDDILNY
jgi:prepilin-type N-terminal cleavage/methylation domain-containing protein